MPRVIASTDGERAGIPPAAIVALAVVAGALVRLIPVVSTDFPINDGGLFASMIEDLVRHGPLPPATVSYNHGDIPFAYPPLALYLGAGMVALGVPTLDVLRFVPVTVAIALIPAWYLLARELVEPRLAAVATLLFALFPRSFEWLIAGGGLTRGLGLLFAVLGLRYALIYMREGHLLGGVIGGLLLGLAILTHPEAAVFGASSLLLFAWVRRARFGRVLAIGAIALAVATPWLAFVLVTHGLGPLLNAGMSRVESYLPLMLHLMRLDLTEEVYTAFGALLGGIGLFLACTSGRGWLVGWMITVSLLTPAAAPTLVMFPLSIAGAITVTDLVIPRLSPAWRPRVLVVGLVVLLLNAAWSNHDQDSGLRGLQPKLREAMHWPVDEFGDDSIVLIATGALWATDAVSEWYPYLTDGVSIATVQGREFTPEWAEARNNQRELAECARRSFSCVMELASRVWPSAEFLFIPIVEVPGVGPDATMDLIEGARLDGEVVYDGPAALVVKLGR